MWWTDNANGNEYHYFSRNPYYQMPVPTISLDRPAIWAIRICARCDRYQTDPGQNERLSGSITIKQRTEFSARPDVVHQDQTVTGGRTPNSCYSVGGEELNAAGASRVFERVITCDGGGGKAFVQRIRINRK